MPDSQELLKKELASALQTCQNSHSSNINRDYLGLFVRAAKNDPEDVATIVDIFISHIGVHRSNLVSSLYGLIKLADVSDKMKKIISSKLPSKQIDYYMEDGDPDVRGNATILKEVLSGVPLSNFKNKSEKKEEGDTINNYNLNNSNLSINSPYSTQTVHIENIDSFDEDTKKLLKNLRDSLNKKDKNKALQILGFIANKSFDLFVAILAGKVLKG